MKAHVEFDDCGNQLVNKFDEFSSKYLMLSLLMFFYIIPISIGLHSYDTLVKSHFVRISAYVLGFCASVFSWFSALLVPWFIFGANYDFAKDVYRLYSNCDFRISITLMFLMLPASRFLTRTINRAVTSSRNRRILFITISIVAVSSFVSICNYLESVNNPRAYIFSFCVLSIIYFILIIQRSIVDEPRKQQRQNPFETSSFNL